MFVSPIKQEEIEAVQRDCTAKADFIPRRKKEVWHRTIAEYKQFKQINSRSTQFFAALVRSLVTVRNKATHEEKLKHKFAPPSIVEQQCDFLRTMDPKMFFELICRFYNDEQQVVHAMSQPSTDNKYIGEAFTVVNQTTNQNQVGVPHGTGEMWYCDGTYYSGGFQFGKRHGHGKIIYKDGRHYSGSFVNDQRHGEGEFAWGDGRKYWGSYVHNEKHGHGVHIWPSCSKYLGLFENNKRCGFGIYVWKDRKIFCGEYDDDRRHGWGVLFYPVTTCGGGKKKRWIMGSFHLGEPVGKFFVTRDVPYTEIYAKDGTVSLSQPKKKPFVRYVWVFDDQIHHIRLQGSFCNVSFLF